MKKILIGLFFCLFLATLFYFLLQNRDFPEQEKKVANQAVISSKVEEKIAKNISSTRDVEKKFPKKYRRAVAEAIRTNDLCALMEVPIHQFNFCYELLEPWKEEIKKDPEIEEILSKNGALFSITPKKRNSKAARLFEALRLAGLYEVCGKNGYAVLNLAESDRIMKELEAEDSQNAAYPYYHMAILKAKKAKPEELDALMEKIHHSSYFDSHLAKVTSFIYQASLVNETFWMHGRTILNQWPVPNINGSLSYLRSMAEVSDKAPAVLFLGGLMMESAVRSNRPYWEHTYIPMEYSLGRTFSIRADKRNFSEIPEHQKLIARDLASVDLDIQVDDKNCSQDTVREVFSKIR